MIAAQAVEAAAAVEEPAAAEEPKAEEKKAEYMSLILSTVTGVSAGLQNTG